MEENKAEQFLDLLDLNVGLEDLKTFLKSCVEYGVFISQDDSANTVVPRAVNNCLNNKKTRFKGLLLLKEFIPYCSTEIYSEHSISWMLQCLRASNQDDLQITVLSLEIFAKLVEKSVKFTEVRKETENQIVPKFLSEYLTLKDNHQIILNVLSCLEKCMKLYSRSFESQREHILQYLMSLLEFESRLVPEVANCISLLPGLGGGGKQGVTYKSSWKHQHDLLIFVLHEILDHLFVNITEIQPVRKPEVQNSHLKIAFSKLPNKNFLSNAQCLARRLTGICECLCAMYLKSFSVPKEINHKSVLELICRGLTVTRASLSNKVSLDSLALTSVLPTIHINFLRMLESFILCCNRNILPEGNLICKLLNYVIKSTSAQTWPYAINKPYRSTRLATYKCLCTWLSIAQNASCLYKVSEELVPAILSDIYSKKPTITLTICRKSVKGGKKHWKKQLGDLSKTNKDQMEKVGDMAANKQLCVQALTTLELIINTASALLKPELYKMIEINVVQILTELNGGSMDIPIPYSNADCRDHIYRLLLALCLQNDLPKYTLTLFTAGLNDISSQVRSRCLSAISSLEKIYYPSAPSLHFPKTHEDNILTMTEKDILNSSLSTLSKNGVMAIQIIGDEDASSSNKNEKINETVVEEKDENKAHSYCNYQEDPNEKYFNNDYEVPSDSEIEVIDIGDSDNEDSRSELHDIYEDIDEEETFLSGCENENTSQASEDFETNLLNSADSECEILLGGIQNDLLNGNLSFDENEESEAGMSCRDTLDSVSENPNYETQSDVGDLLKVNNNENVASSLKRINDEGLNEDLCCHILNDGQPEIKKTKIQKETIDMISTEDENVEYVCKIPAENGDAENISSTSPEDAEIVSRIPAGDKDDENVRKISSKETECFNTIPSEDEGTESVSKISSKNAEDLSRTPAEDEDVISVNGISLKDDKSKSVSKIPAEDTENVSRMSAADICENSMLEDFVDSVC